MELLRESSLFNAVINVRLITLLLSYRKKLSLINSLVGIALNSLVFCLSKVWSKIFSLIKVLSTCSVQPFVKSFISPSEVSKLFNAGVAS